MKPDHFLRPRTVTVTLPSANLNLKQVQDITASLMKRLGHEGCYSGFDLRFIHEDLFRVNDALQVVSVGV
jgi:hypothetical protein